MRNPQLERDFLEHVTRRAKLSGYDAYPEAVLDRLAVGAQRYGDNAFMDRDNFIELLEETPDLAAYALLEVQRIHQDQARGLVDDDTAQMVLNDLTEAAVHGALADYHARRAQERMKAARPAPQTTARPGCTCH